MVMMAVHVQGCRVVAWCGGCGRVAVPAVTEWQRKERGGAEHAARGPHVRRAAGVRLPVPNRHLRRYTAARDQAPTRMQISMMVMTVMMVVTELSRVQAQVRLSPAQVHRQPEFRRRFMHVITDLSVR